MSALNGVTSAIVGAANVASGGSSHQVDRSLRFASDDTANLYKSFSSSTSTTKSTISFWVKRGKLGFRNTCFSGYGSISGSYRFCQLEFQADDTVLVGNNVGATFETTQVFRDPSAWYHFVLAFDTTQASSSDRVKFYVNGSQVTDLNSTSYPGQNADALIFGDIHNFIAANQSSGSAVIPGDIYLAEMHFVDGQGLAPTDFGEYDSNNNWNPKDCKDDLTYGTHGFYLTFSDNSSASALGTDTSGNGNNWTVNNISVAAGSDNDSLIDTPTNYEADSGNNGGNYATLNPVDQRTLTGGPTYTLSQGNLTCDMTGGSGASSGDRGFTTSTLQLQTGKKWYWEVEMYYMANNDIALGIASAIPKGYYALSGGKPGAYLLRQNGNFYYPTGQTGADSSRVYNDGDIIGIAVDLSSSTKTITFYKNGSSLYSYNVDLDQGPFTFACGTDAGGGNTYKIHCNFGQRPFDISSVPTDHLSLCTQNLADPTIADGFTAFDVALWTGNGSSQTVSSLNFNPDIIWTKTRSNSVDSKLVDTVRGISEVQETNQARADSTDTNGVTSTSATGFSLGSSGDFNTNGRTYVGWTWDAGTSTVSNSDGSLTSNVRANQSTGCSIVTFTTNSSSGNATVGHGLSAVPAAILMKADTTYNWDVYLSAISNSKDGRLMLNSGDAFSTTYAPFGGVDPTSSVFTMDQGFYGTGITSVAYCFAEVEGFSKVGSYTGNGDANGPFVYTGFRPRWVMAKSQTYAGNFNIFDARRPEFNETDGILRSNTSGAEFDGSAQGSFSIGVDLLSNGFKLRQSGIDANQSGQTLVYLAFAEHPFKTSRAR